jgi:diguanylate cyclase (GGDEF)-like protein
VESSRRASTGALQPQLAALFDALADMIAVVDADSRLCFANAAARVVLGAAPLGQTVDLDVLPGPATVVDLGNGARAHVVRRSLGAGDSGRALRDPLTGLANRALLVEALAGALARMTRSGRRPAVMFLDLDGFKAVNDAYGHETGDDLLIEVARRVLECVRTSDVVARFGGDEFVVVLEDVEDVGVVQRISDRILRRLSDTMLLRNAAVRIGVSIGVSMARDDTTSADELLGEADAAMYRAKRAGKHQWRLFDDELRARFEAKAQLRKDLAGALDRDEFVTLYTPVARAIDGELSTLEVTLRWLHPTRGELGPSEFLPLARELGLARELDHYALRDAASVARRWNSDSGAVPITVWVTVGVHDLLAGELQSFVAHLVEEAALGPGSLGIEVPLATLMEHPPEAERALQSIAWHGVRVAVDDFGADMFSPAQLQRFHVDTVTLDRRLIGAADRAPEALSMLAGVVAMARALGLEVLAKGVTSTPQLELLQELGCSLVQGSRIAEPHSADAIDALVAGQTPWRQRGWPTALPLSAPMTRIQVVERLLKLRAA